MQLPLWIFLSVIFLVMMLVIAAKTLAVAKEDELLVVFRLGRLLTVYGPGRSMVVPFIDRVIRVKLETIPGWQELSEDELQHRAAELATKSLTPNSRRF
jgi:regulator of protease activity HflC (stomatin/prohibitin superfamily)